MIQNKRFSKQFGIWSWWVELKLRWRPQRSIMDTVLVLIILTKFAVALRLRCVAVPVNWFFDIILSFFLHLKTLYTVWSLVRRRVIGVTSGSKLYATLLNIAKYFKTLRWGCVAVAFSFSIYLKPVLYL